MYGHYVKAARIRMHLSVPELAARAGITADALYKLERNANNAELATLDSLACGMGLLVGDVLPNSGRSAGSDLFEPIEAALSGMDEEEMREQVLILANQARMVRNALARRREDRPSVVDFTKDSSSDDAVVTHPGTPPVGVQGGTAKEGDTARDHRRRARKPRRRPGEKADGG